MKNVKSNLLVLLLLTGMTNCVSGGELNPLLVQPNYITEGVSEIEIDDILSGIDELKVSKSEKFKLALDVFKKKTVNGFLNSVLVDSDGYIIAFWDEKILKKQFQELFLLKRPSWQSLFEPGLNYKKVIAVFYNKTMSCSLVSDYFPQMDAYLFVFSPQLEVK